MDLTTATERSQRSSYLVKPRYQSARSADHISRIPVIHLQGARLHAITEQECVDIVMKELDAGRRGSIMTMNLDHLRRFIDDFDYQTLCNKSTLHVADGMPLVWASALQGTPLPERVTGSNLIWSLSQAAAKNGRSIFLLGGQPGTAQFTADTLQSKYEGLKIAGAYCPPFGFEDQPDSFEEMIEVLVKSKPDIIYVALGSPKQEALIEKLESRLPAVWWLGVGISFSFVSGHVARAPKWMQKMGLEWLHRLLQEPSRLAKRYLVDGLPFFIKLQCKSLLRRLS